MISFLGLSARVSPFSSRLLQGSRRQGVVGERRVVVFVRHYSAIVLTQEKAKEPHTDVQPLRTIKRIIMRLSREAASERKRARVLNAPAFFRNLARRKENPRSSMGGQSVQGKLGARRGRKDERKKPRWLITK